MKLHLTWKLSAEHEVLLRSCLPPECHLSHGQECPPDTQILVQGRPSADELDRLPNLTALVIPFAGIPVKTRELLRQRPSLTAFNLHFNAASTAEMAIGLMLAVSKRICRFDEAMRQGRWALPDMPLHSSLDGKAVMVLGYGAIGSRVASICRAFDMRVSVLRRSDGAPTEQGIQVLNDNDWREHLAETDFLHLCLPHTEETEGIISEAEIKRLPAQAVIVNTARGPLIDEDALFSALSEKRILGAGLDVWWNYPEDRLTAFQEYPSKHHFEDLDNVVMTPHRAGDFGDAALEQRRISAVGELVATLIRTGGHPNQIDPKAGY